MTYVWIGIALLGVLFLAQVVSTLVKIQMGIAVIAACYIQWLQEQGHETTGVAAAVAALGEDDD